MIGVRRRLERAAPTTHNGLSAHRPAAEGEEIPDFGQHRTLADRTLHYIVATRPLHERLLQMLTQVAGFSLLVVVPGRSVPMLDAPIALARAALRPAREELDALPVPHQARHHHHHLIAAADALVRSVDLLTDCLRADADDAARAALVRCLRAATDQLRAAARLLPGFEMADLNQACCAAHAGPRALSCG